MRPFLDREYSRSSQALTRRLAPRSEYILWTDVTSRKFIATNYPWFLSTFDNYPYPIQRADAIRYFVLHSFGGIYMDLDVGCQRNMDPLLYYPVSRLVCDPLAEVGIAGQAPGARPRRTSTTRAESRLLTPTNSQVVLPATIPVGVSNDIMFSEKGHPFMDLVIHNLVTFNHQYGTNYPTVMFSTGPMFLSAQVGFWHKQNPISLVEVRQVRVLPRRWYGKNAPAEERESAYFSHLYGSSWHACVLQSSPVTLKSTAESRRIQGRRWLHRFPRQVGHHTRLPGVRGRSLRRGPTPLVEASFASQYSPYSRADRAPVPRAGPVWPPKLAQQYQSVQLPLALALEHAARRPTPAQLGRSWEPGCTFLHTGVAPPARRTLEPERHR